MKLYKKYLSKYKWTYTVILLFAAVASVCGLLKTYFLSIIIDDVIQLRNISLLKSIIVILILMAVAEQGISYIVGYMNTNTTQEISLDLRKRIMDKLGKACIAQMQKKSSNDFAVNVTDDVGLITNLLCNYFVTLINSIFTALITIGFIMLINIRLALISLVIVVVQIIISCRLSGIVRKNQSNILVNNSVHLGIIRQITDNIKYIRAYRSDKEMLSKYDGISRKTADLNYKSYLISFVYSSINTILGFAGSMVIFVLGVLAVYNGEMSIGILFVFDSLTGILSKSISGIVSVVIEYTKGFVSMKRIDEIWALDDETDGGKSMNESIDSIEFRDVSFAYDDNRVIDNFSYNFRKGNTYAVIGSSGIGKSTLAGLLLKFYDSYKGSILINSSELSELSAADIRDRVTIVFQEGVILGGCSLRDNITFGKDVPEEKLQAVIAAAKINAFAEKMSDGIDTVINYNGTNLSGGEKQRIYVARAMLRDSDVYIFDEAFSAMDAGLEKSIISLIEKEFSDKIVIFISHDIESIRKYENIIVFEDNRKISVGNDSELLKKSDNYLKFVKGA